MSQPTKYEQGMTHARVALMNNEEAMFMYNVCFQLEFKWCTDTPTASVDGYIMRFNPDYWLKLSHKMHITLLAHETGHVIREHMARRGNRNPEIYNWAGDYVINQELKDAGYTPITWKMDDGRDNTWLQDDRFKGMTTEQVYDILLAENPPQPKSGDGGNPGGSGSGTPDPHGQWRDLIEPDKGEAAAGGGGDKDGKPVPSIHEVKQHLDEILVSAAMAAVQGGQPGSIPGDVQIYLDSLLKPKLPMASHLRRFFQAIDKSDYSWSRPNRRRLPMYLPTMRGEALCHLAFAFDMSASVKDSDIKRYVSEMVGVLRNLKPDKITLILFDTSIRSITTVKTVKDMMDVKLIGRGGTDVGDLLEWARKNNPKALCVFTDGEFHDFGFRKPACPILWMIHNKRRTFSWNYGTVIPFEV